MYTILLQQRPYAEILPERACVLPEIHRQQRHHMLVGSRDRRVTVSFTSSPVLIRGVDRGEGKQLRTDFDKHNELQRPRRRR
jgi:hypothetical protein